jgi:hypothetical protein
VADSVQLPATGSGTADVIVRTDQDPTTLEHYQYVKLADGADGSFVPIATEGQTGGQAVRLLVEDVRLRRLLEEFLVATVEPTFPRWLNETASNIATRHVTVSNKPTLVLPGNQARRRVTLANYQTVTIYFGGDGSVATNNGVRLDAGASVTLRTRGEVWAVTTNSYSPVGEDDRAHAWEEFG